MPQMAPYNWLMLNLIFLFIYLIFLIFIHFNVNKTPFLPPSLKLKKFNFKW